MFRYFFLILIFNITLANDLDRAVSSALRAISKYKKVKKIQKNIQKQITRKVFFNSRTIASASAVGISIISKKEIDTRAIKKLQIKFFNANIRPDIAYRFEDKEVRANIKLDWGF